MLICPLIITIVPRRDQTTATHRLLDRIATYSPCSILIDSILSRFTLSQLIWNGGSTTIVVRGTPPWLAEFVVSYIIVHVPHQSSSAARQLVRWSPFSSALSFVTNHYMVFFNRSLIKFFNSSWLSTNWIKLRRHYETTSVKFVTCVRLDTN
jgi:hypothetical protein